MPLRPLWTASHALFLDFDGTLTELAPRPEAVSVATGLTSTVAALHGHMGGALAIMTGRPEVDIDHFLNPFLDGPRPERLPAHALGREGAEQFKAQANNRAGHCPPMMER